MSLDPSLISPGFCNLVSHPCPCSARSDNVALNITVVYTSVYDMLVWYSWKRVCDYDTVLHYVLFIHSLQELHLNKNEYSQVNLDPSFQHTTLKRLHINNNLFLEWTEIEKFSSAFPNLQALVALSNPLSGIPVRNTVFPELTSLNLNGTKISDWASIEQLNSLPKLSDLALLKVPLCKGMEEKKRRMAVVARMPNLTKLNKSMISDTEREDAERWLIRNHEHDSNHPAIYTSLVEKHGTLNPLADVDFSRNEVRLEFIFDDRASEIHHINLCQTTLQLKRWLGKRIGMRPSTLRLIYVDTEVVEYYYSEEMRWNGKYLDAYRMKDGDKIEVRMK